jgi:hypothetical protein
MTDADEDNARGAALPASVCDRKRPISGFHGHDRRGRGMPESAPCSLIAAGSASRAGGSQGRSARVAAPQAPLTRSSGSGSCRRQGAGSLWWRVWFSGSGGWPFCAGDQPWRPEGGARRQPALPRSAGRGRCPGDMMIDWVSPACGDAAAQSDQAVRLACLGPAAADSGSAGAGRGGSPSGECGCGGPGRAGGHVLVTMAMGISGRGGEGVVAELGQDVMGLAEDLAGLGQRGALAVAAVFDLGVAGVVGG